MNPLARQTTDEFLGDSGLPLDRLFDNGILTPRVTDKLPLLSPHQLQVTLTHIFKCDTNPMRSVELISRCVPLEQIQSAVQELFPQHHDALTTAKALLHEAKCYLKKVQYTDVKAPKEWYHDILNTLYRAITNILSVLSIEGLFIQLASSAEVGTKLQRLSDLSNLFYLITSSLVPILGVVYGGVLVTAAFALILGISIAYPAYKKLPLFIPYSENWTRKIHEGKVASQYGKKSCLNTIAQAFTPLSETHPLLIARSKEEKLKVALAFAQAVTRGDYTALQGKEIIYIRTSELLSHNPSFGEENDSISKLERALLPYKKNIILIVDDIHLVVRQEHVNSIEEFTHALRLEATNAPYILGLTTKTEFEQHLKMQDYEFMDLMTPVFVENTDENETVEILREYLLQHTTPNSIEHDVVSSLPQFYKKEAIEPYASLHQLQQKVQERQKPSKIATALEQEQSKLKRLYTQKMLEQGVSLLPYSESHQAIEALEHHVQALETLLQAEEAEKKRHIQGLNQLVQAKEILYSSVLKVAHLSQEHLSLLDKKNLSAFELISHFLLPNAERRSISKQREEAEFSGTIT